MIHFLVACIFIGLALRVIRRSKRFICLDCHSAMRGIERRRPVAAWLLGPFGLLIRARARCKVCRSERLISACSPMGVSLTLQSTRGNK